MKKSEILKFKLSEVQANFDREEYEKSVIALEAAGKMIISALNDYNKTH